MKKKFLSSLIVITMSMSMGVPVFAADLQGKSPQSGTVPVTGSIEKYTPPTPGTEINVSIPTSMVFDIGYNKDTQKANFKSADYTITNNGDTAVDVTSQYDVVDESGVTLTTPDKVNPKDSNLELALSLNAGEAANPTTPWIQNVTDKSTGNTINVDSKATEHMQFSATDQGLANITQHAKDGKLTSETDVKGNLVLTFNAKQDTTPTQNWSKAYTELNTNTGDMINAGGIAGGLGIRQGSPQGITQYKVNNGKNQSVNYQMTPGGFKYANINCNLGDTVSLKLNSGTEFTNAPKNIKIDNGWVTLKITPTGAEYLLNN